MSKGGRPPPAPAPGHLRDVDGRDAARLRAQPGRGPDQGGRGPREQHGRRPRVLLARAGPGGASGAPAATRRCGRPSPLPPSLPTAHRHAHDHGGPAQGLVGLPPELPPLHLVDGRAREDHRRLLRRRDRRRRRRAVGGAQRRDARRRGAARELPPVALLLAAPQVPRLGAAARRQDDDGAAARPQGEPRAPLRARG